MIPEGIKRAVRLGVRSLLLHKLRSAPEREQLMRRLRAKWHPDKNVQDPRFATLVTQAIEIEVARGGQ